MQKGWSSLSTYLDTCHVTVTSHVSWDLPVPGKAVVAVMAEENLVLDILLLGEGEGLLVVVAKPKSFIFNCEHIQEVVSCYV